ncbi:hypothetical protein AAC387_Pa11g0592 [Persea americana]
MFRKSQNISVIVKGDEETGNQDHYGVLTDIIQLDVNTSINDESEEDGASNNDDTEEDEMNTDDDSETNDLM